MRFFWFRKESTDIAAAGTTAFLPLRSPKSISPPDSTSYISDDGTYVGDDEHYMQYRESTIRSLEPLAKLSMSSTASAYTVGVNDEATLDKPLRTLLLNPRLVLKYRDAARRTSNQDVQFQFAQALLDAAKSVEDIHPLRPFQSTDSDGYYQLMNEGVYWMTQLAKKKHTEACFIVGTWYQKSQYWFEKDLRKARKLFIVSAKQGYPPAMYSLGQIEQNSGDIESAKLWYLKAYQHKEPNALYLIGMCYLKGNMGFDVNLKAAYLALCRAAEHPANPISDANFQLSQALLQLPLLEGATKEEIEAKSYLYLREASRLGHMLAVVKLAKMGRE
ncbi:hypothetical protein H4219_002618 [Mycoemilia scoparia]|uniref:Uncharacterized protein n=1 Tax=Mycoemilia scoparia TaxID=417184 RepID=A0A9W8A2T4_9FUNG|nr:hypothetical protein H4219_002618 [Mycoemilia scoparia]